MLFSDVIGAIDKYAFVSSPYPVILSLEIHCSLDQQITIADVLKNILGERLVQAPMQRLQDRLPSPEELKYKILVKVTYLLFHWSIYFSAKRLHMKPTSPVSMKISIPFATLLVHPLPRLPLMFLLIFLPMTSLDRQIW